MDNHVITNWVASNGELGITVVSKPLGMTQRYVWKYHTTNHYGQGAKYCWWHENKEQTVFGAESQNLLTALVQDHSILSKLVEHYRFRMMEGNEILD